MFRAPQQTSDISPQPAGLAPPPDTAASQVVAHQGSSSESWAGEPAARRPVSLVAWMSGRMTSLAVRYPLLTLCLALVAASSSGLLALGRLQLRASRLDLLSPESHYNQRWLRYLDTFGDHDDGILMVVGDSPPRVAEALQWVGERLARQPQLTGVLYDQGLSGLVSKQLYLWSAEQRYRVYRSLRELAEGTARGLPGDDGAIQLAAYTTSDHPLLADPPALGGQLLVEDAGRIGLCLVRLPHPDQEPVAASRQLALVRQQQAAARKEFPDLDFLLTGMPVLEADEGASSQRDAIVSTLVSFVLVGLIFRLGFRRWQHPLLSLVTLGFSLVMTLGAATLLVGHLNLLSVAFSAILVGLGIDFSIHYVARVETLLAQTPGMGMARGAGVAAEQVGPAILTGGLTTASAFGVAGLTPFLGVAELGIISAAGIVISVLATLTVLPALMVWADSLGRRVSPVHRLAAGRPAPSAVRPPPVRLPDRPVVGGWCVWLGAVASLLVTWAGVDGLSRLSFDHNLLNLHAGGSESVAAEGLLRERTGSSTWYAILVADSDAAALRLAERLEQLPEVSRVEHLGQLLGGAAESGGQVGRIDQVRREIAACHWAAERAAERLRVWPAAMGAAPESAQRLVTTVLASTSNVPPSLSDISPGLTERMVGRGGERLLRVYASENIWDREPLERFVRALEGVEPSVTGHPVQAYYASEEMRRSFLLAALYASLAVAAWLMLDLGSLRLVGLAMLPVAVSLLQLGCVMAWLGLDFNPANLIALPLIMGIGLDDGVHVLHDFRGDGSKNWYWPSAATLRALVLTSLTTMAGFGSLMLASHQGLASLGCLLVLGVALCLLNSLLLLPALLRSLSRSLPTA
jgi:predicted RND superfamily exporter protein